MMGSTYASWEDTRQFYNKDFSDGTFGYKEGCWYGKERAL